MAHRRLAGQLLCVLLVLSIIALDCASLVSAAKKRPRSSSSGGAASPGSARSSSSANSNSGIPPAFLQQASTSPHGIIDLPNPQSFVQITSGARNYSSVVLLTAVKSGVSCQPCNTFAPVYETLAKSWKSKSRGSSKADVIFSLLEFKDGQDVFRQLQLSYAPVLLFFPPTSGPKARGSGQPIKYDFNRLGFEGPEVASFLSDNLGFAFPYVKPFPWSTVLSFFGSAGAIVASIILLAPKIAQARGQGVASIASAGSKLIWTALCLATIVVMTSGYMWNSIRGAPYLMMGPKGKPEYFAAGFQNQYGAETTIVGAFYALLAFSFVSLTVFVPAQRDPVRQRAGVYVWSVIFLATFSLLFAVFRIKNPSYPFRLFF
ncbi:Oligosaccharyltransferase, gamma subunit [Ceraceosorus bombacis]|uniref:Oligosaccharyltransferase, gamma subunit n=1 Tax=Ceraceosorus bombacis TaxID=401625 RepID=A0A0P1BQB6_9BASI|nr:Oligosaccharyltransferase, gamma subunit [Ceraceosorus bombacis]